MFSASTAGRSSSPNKSLLKKHKCTFICTSYANATIRKSRASRSSPRTDGPKTKLCPIAQDNVDLVKHDVLPEECFS